MPLYCAGGHSQHWHEIDRIIGCFARGPTYCHSCGTFTTLHEA